MSVIERDAHSSPGLSGLPLRERKKLKMRAAMVDVSQRLFREQGYAATTLEQIAAELDVRPQTILRYFDSKANLALARIVYKLEQFREKVTDPDRTTPVLDLWRDEIVTSPTSGEDSVEVYFDWALREPLLVAMTAELNNQFEDVIAAGLERDLGAESERDLRCRLLAALLVGGNSSLLRMWFRGQSHAHDLIANQLAVVDWVESQFTNEGRHTLETVELR